MCIFSMDFVVLAPICVELSWEEFQICCYLYVQRNMCRSIYIQHILSNELFRIQRDIPE